MGVAALSKSIALDMRKFGIRSNAVAPFAYTRMVDSIPDTPENAERNRINKMMSADKIAPSCRPCRRYGCKATSPGQVFGVRRNEIYLLMRLRSAFSGVSGIESTMRV